MTHASFETDSQKIRQIAAKTQQSLGIRLPFLEPNTTDQPRVQMKRVPSERTEQAAFHFAINGRKTFDWEGKGPLPISFKTSIEVPGWGFVEDLVEDADCSIADNCGPGPVSSRGVCAAPRAIPNEPSIFLPKSHLAVDLLGPNHVTAAQPWHGQLLHVSVTHAAGK